MAMRLVDKGGNPVKVGDRIKDFRGEVWTYTGCREPLSEGSSGRVYVKGQLGRGEYYPSVFGLEWKEVE